MPFWARSITLLLSATVIVGGKAIEAKLRWKQSVRLRTAECMLSEGNTDGTRSCTASNGKTGCEWRPHCRTIAPGLKNGESVRPRCWKLALRSPWLQATSRIFAGGTRDTKGRRLSQHLAVVLMLFTSPQCRLLLPQRPSLLFQALRKPRGYIYTGILRGTVRRRGGHERPALQQETGCQSGCRRRVKTGTYQREKAFCR